MRIRSARASEREALERLQRRSSLHHPLYRAQLAAHPEAIELPAGQIAAGHVRVAEQDGVVAGFAVLLERAGDACELDGLFVEPRWMRTGVGRRLIADAVEIARERGAARIDVVANPQAVAFYAAVGFTAAGEAQTRFGPAPRMSLSVSRDISCREVVELVTEYLDGTLAPDVRHRLELHLAVCDQCVRYVGQVRTTARLAAHAHLEAHPDRDALLAAFREFERGV